MFLLSFLLAAPPAETKIVLVVGSSYYKSGEHDYAAAGKVLAKLLAQTPGVKPVVTVDWPTEEQLAGAKAVACFFDGGDKHGVLKGDRAAAVQKLADAGVGIALIHQAVDVPKDFAGRARGWVGGAWEKGTGARAHWVAEFKTFPDHPIARGVTPFTIDDGWLTQLTFVDGAKGIAPLLRTASPKGPKPAGTADVVAWAFDRSGGGRGFGFTGGHLHASFAEPGYRKFFVNGLLWAAGVEIPATGAPVELDVAGLPKLLTPPPAKK